MTIPRSPLTAAAWTLFLMATAGCAEEGEVAPRPGQATAPRPSPEPAELRSTGSNPPTEEAAGLRSADLDTVAEAGFPSTSAYRPSILRSADSDTAAEGAASSRSAGSDAPAESGALSDSADQRSLAALRAFEEARRGALDVTTQVSSDRALGADPIALVTVRHPDTAAVVGRVGLLRGRSEIVLLDASGLRERACVPAPESPLSLAIRDSGELLVAGQRAIGRYRPRLDPAGQLTGLTSLGRVSIAGVHAIRDIAAGPGPIVYVIEEQRGRWLALRLPPPDAGEAQPGPGSGRAPAATAPRSRAARAASSANAPRRGLVRALPAAGAPRREFVRADHSVGPRRERHRELLPESTLGRCNGPVRVLYRGGHVLIDCLLDHALAVISVNPDGSAAETPRWIRHQGPLWSFDVLAGADESDGPGEEDTLGRSERAAARPKELLIAAGGVEDHPLVRADDGAFGHIDSFAFVYRLHVDSDRSAIIDRVSTINLSAHGVITPKWLDLARTPDGALTLRIAGYGGDRMALLRWPAGDPTVPPRIETRVVPPGIIAVAGSAAANPLLDAWIDLGQDPPEVSPIGPPAAAPARSTASKVGEALFFTTLMAPWNRADGPRSRFTCETCHFEGYVDGRVHHSGRGRIRVATKPLLGLANNRPHFSRAQDPSTALMVHSEFRVANRGSGRDPWFSLESASFPWLVHLGDLPPALSPQYLRRAFMSFLFDFPHRPNPARAGRTRWTRREHAGAALFRDHCEDCHRAQLVADEPESRVPFARWETLTMSPQAPIVWADAVYVKSGVEPYVHRHGARVPSLRRLYKKYPYFTNGSAESLPALLERALWLDGLFYHDHPVELPPREEAARVRRLTAEDKRALLAFLALL